ncbi:MAG: PDZ domain-containing protein [Alphaproteobacteria bacterium]|nr:PDZ domain-containing protein [Alphaproteobacteria bacterium]
MARLWFGVIVAIALGAVTVAWLVSRPPPAKGYSGLEFARTTDAAYARAPLMNARGALVSGVAAESPAARAGIRPGAVVAAIDGTQIRSARQASDIIRSRSAGERVTLTLYDEARGAIHPHDIALTFDPTPPVNAKVLTVHPPRTLAKEKPVPPVMVANAAWSRKLAHGVSIRPRAMPLLKAGVCSGVAPERWQVRDFGESMIHLVSDTGGMHAVYKLVRLNPEQRKGPSGYVSGLLHAMFKSPVTPAPMEQRPFGIEGFNFGNEDGAAGFVLFRLNKDVLSAWIVAVPASDIGWAMPIGAGVALSLRCQSELAPASRPRGKGMARTSVSARCLAGGCEDSDFAATYLDKLRLGYVHAKNGDVFLVNPRRDFWLSGRDGPGYYRQLGGENEKLEPGRTN